MLAAAPTLQKRPIKVQNLKPLKPFSPLSHEHTKGLVHSIESRYVIGSSNTLFAECVHFSFSPKADLQAGTVKGLKDG